MNLVRAVKLLALLLALPDSSWATGDPANGETLYNLNCAYCHSLVPEPEDRPGSARNDSAEILQQLGKRQWRPSEPMTRPDAPAPKLRRGPHLAGLLQRAPGAVTGFPYRFVWQIEGGRWDPAELDRYIEFHARLDAPDRADLVAYLTRATRR